MNNFYCQDYRQFLLLTQQIILVRMKRLPNESSYKISSSLLENSRENGMKKGTNSQYLYKEVIIETTDIDVPVIIYHKLERTNETRKQYILYRLNQIIQSNSTRKTTHAFQRILTLKFSEKIVRSRVEKLQLLLKKIFLSKIQSSFHQICFYKSINLKKTIGCKLLNNVIGKNYQHSLNQTLSLLRTFSLNNFIGKITNEQELSKQLMLYKKQNQNFKELAFTKQFIAEGKQHEKVAPNQALFAYLENTNFREILVEEVKRIETIRIKRLSTGGKYNSKSKDNNLYDNEVVLRLMHNLWKASEISNNLSQKSIEELTESLNNYTNQQGIHELHEVIAGKEGIIRSYETVLAEISRMDVEFKKYSSQPKANQDKIITLILNQVQRIQKKEIQEGDSTFKIYQSRTFMLNYMHEIYGSLTDKSNLDLFLLDLEGNSSNLKKLEEIRRKYKQDQQILKLINVLVQLNKHFESGRATDEYNSKQAKRELEVQLAQHQQTIQQLQFNYETILNKNNITSQRESNKTNSSQKKAFELEIRKLELKIKDAESSREQAAKHFKEKQEQSEVMMETIKFEKKILEMQVIKLEELMQNMQIRASIPINSEGQGFSNKIKPQKKSQDAEEHKAYEIKLQQKNRELNSVIENLSNQLAKLSTNYHERMQQQDAYSRKQEQLIKQVSSLTIQKENGKFSHNQEINRLTILVSSCQIKIRELEIECNQKDMMVANLQNKINEMQVLMSSTHEKNKRDEVNFVKNQDLVKELHRRNQDLMSKYTKQLKENQHLRQNLMLRKDQLFRLEDKIRILEKNISDKDHKHQQTLLQIDRKNSSIQHYNQLLIESKQIVSKLNAEIFDFKDKRFQDEKFHEQKIAEKNTEIAKMEFASNNQKNQIRDLEGKIMILSHHSQKTEVEVQDASFKDECYKQIEFLNKKIESLQNFILDLKDQHQNLIHKYEIEKIKSMEAIVTHEIPADLENFIRMEALMEATIKEKDNLLVENGKLKQQVRSSHGQIHAPTPSQPAPNYFERRQHSEDNKFQFQLSHLTKENQRLKTQLKMKNKNITDQFEREKGKNDELAHKNQLLNALLEKSSQEWSHKEKYYQVEIEKMSKDIRALEHEEVSNLHRKNNFTHRVDRSRCDSAKDLAANGQISEEIRKLISNNQILYLNLGELQIENKELRQKLELYPQPEYIIQLLYNILLSFSAFDPNSEEATALWEDLFEIKENFQMEHFFMELERYSKQFISLKTLQRKDPSHSNHEVREEKFYFQKDIQFKRQ